MHAQQIVEREHKFELDAVQVIAMVLQGKQNRAQVTPVRNTVDFLFDGKIL